MEHFVSFFQLTCIDTPAEVEFTRILRDILTDLPTKYSTEFVYDFFIPLVNSYKSIPIVLLPTSRGANMYLDKPNRVLTSSPIAVN